MNDSSTRPAARPTARPAARPAARRARRSPADDPATADTRARLLEAARTTVRDHGLAGATSRQITSAAGANLAAITYHFGSKDDLIAEALFDDLDRRVRPALELFDQADDATTALVLAVQQLTSELDRSRDDALAYLETLLLATRDARYRRRALALYRDLGDRLAELLARLIDEGVVPGWVDPVPMASLVLAIANGIALQGCLDPKGPPPSALAGQFAGILLAVANP
ncbi:MAG: TetR family transcriptional regulator C-terminal domain-containing protein [Acidimicrobiales bacterium]